MEGEKMSMRKGFIRGWGKELFTTDSGKTTDEDNTFKLQTSNFFLPRIQERPLMKTILSNFKLQTFFYHGFRKDR